MVAKPAVPTRRLCILVDCNHLCQDKTEQHLLYPHQCIWLSDRIKQGTLSVSTSVYFWSIVTIPVKPKHNKTNLAVWTWCPSILVNCTKVLQMRLKIKVLNQCIFGQLWPSLSRQSTTKQISLHPQDAHLFWLIVQKSFRWDYKSRYLLCIHMQKQSHTHIKDPVAHVWVWWIMATPKQPSMD